MKETYENIVKLIQANEGVKSSCRKSLQDIEHFFLSQGPKGYSSGMSYQDFDAVHGSRSEIGYNELQIIMQSADKLKSMIELQDNILSGLYDAKNSIDETLNSLKGIPHDVAYLKLVKGYSLIQIADELNISQSYAEKISAKM